MHFSPQEAIIIINTVNFRISYCHILNIDSQKPPLLTSLVNTDVQDLSNIKQNIHEKRCHELNCTLFDL